MSLGPAGTGKSFLAVSVGITMLMEKKKESYFQDLRSKQEKTWISTSDMKDKVDPYLRPLYDALYELFGADKIEKN